MNNKNAVYWIDRLGLISHPEGGHYKSTFTSDVTVSGIGNISENSQRQLFTSIYFLLKSDEISHFHRLKSDELWYFHGGSSLTVHVIYPDGEYKEMKLGLNLENGEVPQVLVPKNTIFGSSVMEENTFALVGCMVSPGFDFEDFELFSQKELLELILSMKKLLRRWHTKQNKAIKKVSGPYFGQFPSKVPETFLICPHDFIISL